MRLSGPICAHFFLGLLTFEELFLAGGPPAVAAGPPGSWHNPMARDDHARPDWWRRRGRRRVPPSACRSCGRPPNRRRSRRRECAAVRARPSTGMPWPGRRSADRATANRPANGARSRWSTRRVCERSVECRPRDTRSRNSRSSVAALSPIFTAHTPCVCRRDENGPNPRPDGRVINAHTGAAATIRRERHAASRRRCLVDSTGRSISGFVNGAGDIAPIAQARAQAAGPNRRLKLARRNADDRLEAALEVMRAHRRDTRQVIERNRLVRVRRKVRRRAADGVDTVLCEADQIRAAAFTRPEPGLLGLGGCIEKLDAIGARPPARAAGPAVDARRRDAVDKRAVRRAITRRQRFPAHVETGTRNRHQLMLYHVPKLCQPPCGLRSGDCDEIAAANRSSLLFAVALLAGIGGRCLRPICNCAPACRNSTATRPSAD